MITEPLFSAGGVIDLPEGWLQKLKKKCEQRGALLIVDEAQTGLAKLGTMWAFQQEGGGAGHFHRVQTLRRRYCHQRRGYNR